MQLSYNSNAPCKHVNLTANSNLVNLVKEKKGNLSDLSEQSMFAFLAKCEFLHWEEENRVSFESYNRMIEERGLLSEDIGILL